MESRWADPLAVFKNAIASVVGRVAAGTTPTTAGLLATLALGSLFTPARSVEPALDEMLEVRRWVAARLGGKRDATPPFSFVCGGKPSGGLLAGWTVVENSRKLDDQRTGRTIAYTDPETRLEARCEAIEYADAAAAEWVLHLRNGGNGDTPILEHIWPLDIQRSGGPDGFVVHYSLGDSNSADSFAPVEKPLRPGDAAPLVLAPKGGRSSGGVMPFFNVQGPDGGIVIAVGWSGQWEAGFEPAGDQALRIRAGQQLMHLRLHPGETIRTPRILLLFWKGREPLRGNNLFRRILMEHYMPRRDGKLVFSPICASVNWADPDGTYEGPHTRVLPALAERGIEVFWSDMDPQHWYPGGFPNGTGTWEPDPAKYPRGLKPVGEAIRKAGLEYLLWFEPERVHPGTRIDREHPEWVMKPRGEWSQLFRLHDPAARQWLTDHIDTQVAAARLAWIRWDFNVEPLGFWRRNDPPDRQGVTEIRHLEGLYAMWEELRARHPGLVIDNCASGGRRIDLETCARGLPQWHSDLQCSGKPNPTADQLQNGGLFRWVPMHGCGNFDYEPSYTFRSAMTAGNVLIRGTAQGRLIAADADTADAVKRTAAIYRKIRPYMLGDFHPLFPHTKSEETWYGYQFHRSDLNGGVAILFRRNNSPDAAMTIRLRDIDAASRYEVSYEDTPDRMVVKGSKLSAFHARIETAPGATILYYGRFQ